MSRLLENSESIRETLEARNLYTPEDPYELDNSRLVDTVNALSSIIKPFTSFDLSNTVIGRIIGPNTPIAQIGLQMLGTQFAYNLASNAAQEFLPSINFSNLFDGDPSTKLFTTKVDFEITRNRTRRDIFEVIDDLVGRTPKTSPLNKLGRGTLRFNGIENIEYTGKGVVQSLTEQVNMNFFKNSNSQFQIELDRKDFELGNSSNLVRSNYFITQDSDLYPFDQYKSPLYNSANQDYISSLQTYYKNPPDDFNGLFKVSEYGKSQTFLDNLGGTEFDLNNDGSLEYDINYENYGIDDTPTNKLVWGRDGTSFEYDSDVAGLTEIANATDSRFAGGEFKDRDMWNSFNIQNGLLSYTRQLLNSKGRYASFDLTRKKFQDTNGNVHFNGSPLDTLPDGSARNYSRRHSMLDPYDRYAKAIRFEGNTIYNGNPNSVIYNSVLPKIHPVLDDQNIDVSNMMFSIENLALQVNELGELNDDFDTVLPLCEVGQNGGRLMWFPPYDIRLSEQSVARWETTSFIGRGEPIYTYNNSERVANLSFKLLIDYPPQLLNYKSQADFHKKAAEFFAFGGDGIPDNTTNIVKLEKQINDLIEEKRLIQPTKELADPELPFNTEVSFYFPNDIPKAGNPTGTGVEYVKGLSYEDSVDIGDECGGDNGFNEDFNNFIDEYILQFLNPEPNNIQLNDETYANINFVNIELIGFATTLYETDPTLPASQQRNIEQEYNKQLSQRRIDAVRNYINSRFKTLFSTSRDITSYGVRFIEDPLGSSTSDPANGTEDAICSAAAKEERRVLIRFVHNGNKLNKTVPITTQQEQDRRKIDEDIQALTNKLNNARNVNNSISPCVYSRQEVEEGYQKGFRSIHNGKFYPVFHSQTPEDFHKRLTFLQQCTRQGPAIRKQREEDSLSAKNSVFGRQPVCILRIGDFFHTKVIIDNISFQYEESTWDLNPEGMGMQPMLADITMQMKVIGGQSLKTPIEAIQNAASFNYYANSTFYNRGVYKTATEVESLQIAADTGNRSETSNKAEQNDSRENITTQNTNGES
jgi:hypothetical protein